MEVALPLIVVTTLLFGFFAPLPVALAFLAGNVVMGIAALFIINDE